MKDKNRILPLYVKIPFVLILVTAVVLFGIGFKLSYTIREFGNDLWVLCHESTLCVGTVDGKAVRVSPNNQNALYLLHQSVKGKVLFQEPEETDNVTFTFDCHDKEWQLKISRIDKELIRVKLQGERNYDFYMRAGDRYDTMVRVATQEGYQEPNKPFPAGNED